MTWMERAYTTALTSLRPVLSALDRGEGKIARGIRGRRGVLERMTAWSTRRDPGRPLVWFHAASVGEGLQARAVMEAFRRHDPSAQTAHTFFSPSAESLARSLTVDFADYLPLDLPAEMGRALDLLRPDVVAFSKSDVWPNLTREAARRGVRLALLSGTVPPASSRLTGPARALLRPAYGRLDRAAAISGADAQRLLLLGVRPDAVSVMGDAHFDRVLARADAIDTGTELLRPLISTGGAPTLVAGSTWAADEERLIPALLSVRERIPLRLILAPHEPSATHLEETEARLARSGLRSRRLAAAGEGWATDEVLIVDRVGVLGQLYAVADAAYVGGGWGTAGLHSVLEPAAFGLPILFGPRHSNAREAGELVRVGGAFSSASPPELALHLSRLASDPALRSASGAASRSYVEAGRGAADLGAAIIAELIGRR